MAKPIKIVTITDITKLANFLARSIRARLKWSKQLRNSVRIGKATDRNGVVSIPVQVGVGKDKSGMPLSGMAKAYEYGSGIHGKSGRKYEIVPRRKPFLVFSSTEGGLGLQGAMIRTKKVMHPGVNARPYMKPAMDEAMKRAIPELKRSIKKNLTDSLRLTLKQIGK